MEIFLVLVLSVFIYILYERTQVDISRKFLNSLPFIVFIAKNNKIKYRNESAKPFIGKSVKDVLYRNHLTLGSDDYRYIEDLYLDERKNKSLRCFIFTKQNLLYCVGCIKLNAYILEDASTKSLAATVKMMNNYLTMNSNLQLSIKSILEYTGKLLRSDWVCLYHFLDDDTVQVEEYWSLPYARHQHEINDKIVKHHILYDFKANFNPDSPFKVVTQDELLDDVILDEWNKTGIVCKTVAPVYYHNTLYGFVSYAHYTHVNNSDTSIKMVTCILNFIIGIQVNLKKELQQKRELCNLLSGVVEYLKVENAHVTNMLKQETENVHRLKGLFTYESDTTE